MESIRTLGAACPILNFFDQASSGQCGFEDFFAVRALASLAKVLPGNADITSAEPHTYRPDSSMDSLLYSCYYTPQGERACKQAQV